MWKSAVDRTTKRSCLAKAHAADRARGHSDARLVLWSLTASAQPAGQVYRIGVLMSPSSSSERARIEEPCQAPREYHWTTGCAGTPKRLEILKESIASVRPLVRQTLAVRNRTRLSCWAADRARDPRHSRRSVRLHQVHQDDVLADLDDHLAGQALADLRVHRLLKVGWAR